ncbi:hypothetical protein IH979_00670 [Patescibacteria group bacterium]|nr:hypothetical protein [Patescibacteria group bacterium]
MKLIYSAAQIHNPLEVLRKAGYSHFVDPKTEKESFILRLTAGYYPRFHLYLEERDDLFSFNLHLDQKKPSYKGTAAHGGEYEGPTVEKEMKRLEGWIFSLTGVKRVEEAPEPPPTELSEIPKPESNLFGGIFD